MSAVANSRRRCLAALLVTVRAELVEAFPEPVVPSPAKCLEIAA